MLLTASRTSPQARILHSSASTSSALTSTSATLLQARCASHSRGLCFGAWSMHHGPKTSQRHRAIRYRYLESLNRNLSWDKDANKTIRKAMAALARASEIGQGKKYVNPDEIKSWSDEISGARPGKNIEDVERGAIDHLIRGDKPLSYGFDLWKTPLQNIRHYLESHTDAQRTSESDPTFIDPITNRRRSKNAPKEASSMPLYNDLDGYKATDFSDPPEPAAFTQKYDDLGSYGPVKDPKVFTEQVQTKSYDDLAKYKPLVDSVSTTPQQTKAGYKDLSKYGPVSWNEPDGLRKTTPEETSKEYKDLGKYSTTKIDNPDTPRKLTPEELSKSYDDLDNYKPVEWNEPDGLQKQTEEELSKNYDDLGQYGAVRWNEPDGLRKSTAEELSKNYVDLDKYDEPVVWSEPDGLRRLTPEEQSKNYEDLNSYDAPFVAENSTLRAHAAAQMDTTLKGKPLPTKVDAPVEDFLNKYEDLDKYGPVRWNEPDGLRKLTQEELSKNYDDLHMYGPVKWNEPDGLRALTPEEESKQYQDATLYAPRDLPGPEVNANRIHPEEASKDYKDLPAYHHYENADSAIPRIHPEEASKQYEDIHRYSAYENADPKQERIHPEQASKEYKDLKTYPAAGFEETSATKQIHPEELTKEYEDLDKYHPTTFDTFDSPYPMHPEEATKAYKDLGQYSAIRHNEPDGKLASRPDVIAHGLGEYDSKAGSQDTGNGPTVAYSVFHRTKGFEPNSTDASVESLTAEEVRAATLRRAYERSQLDKAEEGESEATQVSDPAARLTGNYARDFPDEFATSWSTENSSTKSTLFPKDRVQKAEPIETHFGGFPVDHDSAEVSSMDESFPKEGSRPQPSLDRYVKREVRDHYSHEPQGLQTSFAEECGMETLPAMEKHYTNKCASNDSPESYKILAYDPTSQSMSVADATTTGQETQSVSTLADILLRLSNPSKFLPYFESLQKQGYEVMSGSGDVLMFRKVREGHGFGSTHIGPTRVNPIDMMGRSAVGNFASPTGFVNYDALSESLGHDKPVPPLRSRANSGEDDSMMTRGPDGQRKKRRLGRKLILGTAGVAGSAYAVSVISERVSTRDMRREESKSRRH